MAALTPTAAEVLPGTTAVINKNYYFGATVTAGKVVYLDSSNLLQLADAGSASTDAVFGIALNGGGAGQPGIVQTGGLITMGATAAMSIGKIYILSDTAGSMDPVDDAVTAGTVYCSVIGVAVSASSLLMGIINSGVEFAADVA